jgi:hypothetical protein
MTVTTKGCTSNADCPAIGAPCQLCADGTAACPSDDCINGQCVASFPRCPPVDAGAPLNLADLALICANPALCKVCPDGVTNVCAKTEVVNGACVTTFPPCPVPPPDLGVTGACTTTADCPKTPPLGAPCKICPNATPSCPQYSCVNGQCSIIYPPC